MIFRFARFALPPRLVVQLKSELGWRGYPKGILRVHKGNTEEKQRKYTGRSNGLQRGNKGNTKVNQRKYKGESKGIQRKYKGMLGSKCRITVETAAPRAGMLGDMQLKLQRRRRNF